MTQWLEETNALRRKKEEDVESLLSSLVSEVAEEESSDVSSVELSPDEDNQDEWSDKDDQARAVTQSELEQEASSMKSEESDEDAAPSEWSANSESQRTEVGSIEEDADGSDVSQSEEAFSLSSSSSVDEEARVSQPSVWDPRDDLVVDMPEPVSISAASSPSSASSCLSSVGADTSPANAEKDDHIRVVSLADVNEIDLESLLSLCSETPGASSLPSLVTSAPDDISSLSSSDDEVQVDQSRQIENIPVVESEVWDMSTPSDANARFYSKFHEFIKPKDLSRPNRERNPARQHEDRPGTTYSSDCAGCRSPLPVVTPSQRVVDDTKPVPAELYLSFSALLPIFTRFCPRRDRTIVDIGCGTSHFCRELALHGYSHVIGVDCDETTIQYQQRACSELSSFVRFRAMNATQLQVPDRSCHAFFTKATMDIVATRAVKSGSTDELVRIVTELVRCLVTGGVWINVTWLGELTELWTSKIESENGQDSLPDMSLEIPWWKWPRVVSITKRHLDIEATYRAGQPQVTHETTEKPYLVMIWRRKETFIERCRRRMAQVLEEEQQDRRLDAQTRWRQGKSEHQNEEQCRIVASRHMVLEDELSRRCEGLLSNEQQRMERHARWSPLLIASDLLTDMIDLITRSLDAKPAIS